MRSLIHLQKITQLPPYSDTADNCNLRAAKGTAYFITLASKML